MNETPLHRFFRDIPDFLAVIDRDLRIVLCNWKGGYEYVDEALRDRHPHCHEAFYPGQGQPCDSCPVLAVFSSGKPLVVEKTHPRLGPLEVRCFPIFDEQRAVILVGEQVRHIPVRKQLKRDLRPESNLSPLNFEMPLAFHTLDKDGFILGVNQAWLALLGYERDEVVGRQFRNFLTVEYRKAFQVFLSRHKKSGQTGSVELQVQRKKGGPVFLRIEGRTLRVGPAGFPQIHCLLMDNTEQRRAVETIRESELRYRTLMETANDAIFLAEAESGMIIDANRKAEELIGLSLQEIRKLNTTDLYPAEDRPFYLELFQKILLQKTLVEKDIFLVHRNKNRIPVEISASCFRLGNREFVQGIYRDVTERLMAENALREQKERLNYLAYHDPLTNLPNRLLLEDRFHQAMAKASRGGAHIAVLFLDLDRFKQINDTLGHERGDSILRDIARRLGGAVREGDTIARIGGDEFVVLLEGVNGHWDVSVVAEKILDRMAEVHQEGDLKLRVTASIGISLFPDDGRDLDSLIANADSAMYRAKKRGKNTYQFYESHMHSHVHDPLLLESSLRNALEKDQLVLHFQPQWSLASGRVVGTEALVRWQQEELGLVFPDRFIPLAEETGLIIPLTQWVLGAACRQNKEWQERGFPPIPVAVNISPRQFHQGGLVPMVARALEETALKEPWLELEITENMIVENQKAAVRTMDELNGMGVKLTIDDFGTGYSYLGHLKQFPIAKLKIDRSFVRDVLVDEHDAIIVDAMIALARRLNLEVVAEGVETEGQLCFFTEKECHQAQGYLLGRPLPAAETERLFLVKENFGKFCQMSSPDRTRH